MEKANRTGESMQKVSITTELIQAAGNGNFGNSNLNVGPHGTLTMTRFPHLRPFITHSTEASPAAFAIQNLPTVQQYSSINTSSVNDVRQVVTALRRADPVHHLSWSSPLNLNSSAGLYSNPDLSNGHLLFPVNSIDVMSQMLISQRGMRPYYHLPHAHWILSPSGAPPTPDPPQTSLPALNSRGLTTVGIEKRSFPIILHTALQALHLLPGGSDVAAFLPDGRSFCIRDQQKFTDLVLPVFFPKMKGFASLQRQLNLYDFKRVGGMGPDRGCYRHELFHRDFPGYLVFMKRRKIKGP
ncbi:DNA binding protein [Fragilaria crotonensis]|nr:DNA binding protein [Fragilaria crotonensis]